MYRRYLIASLIILLCAGLALNPVFAGEDDEKKPQQSMHAGLPNTHRLTLTLNEAGETFAFSMAVASRHFSMQLGDKNIGLRGRLWEAPDGRELLDYTLEFTQWIEGPDGARQRSGSTWNGSTHLRDGSPAEIATFLNGSFTIRLDTRD